MRLKVVPYTNTRSTVFSLTVYDIELRQCQDVTPYLEVLMNERVSIVDKLHALLMIANEVERENAKTKEREASRRADSSLESEVISTQKSVSVSV